MWGGGNRSIEREKGGKKVAWREGQMGRMLEWRKVKVGINEAWKESKMVFGDYCIMD